MSTRTDACVPLVLVARHHSRHNPNSIANDAKPTTIMVESPSPAGHSSVAPVDIRQSNAPSSCEDLKDPNLNPVCHGPGDAGLMEHSPPKYWEGSSAPRWLQTLVTNVFVVVIVHYTFWFVPAVAVLAWLHASGFTWVAALAVAAYLPSFLSGAHRSGHGKPWSAFRGLRVWNLLAGDYLNTKLLREAPLDTANAKQYVFAFHPHGVLILSRFALFGGNWEVLFPNVDFRFLGASTIFSVPLCRDASLWLGAVDASRVTAERVLQSGKSVAVYPGGIREMFCIDPETKPTTLVLKNQRGFLKLAMRHGAELVPVVVFNEKYLYRVWRPSSSRLVEFFRKTLVVPLIVFWGRFLWMPLVMPEGKTFGAVFGKPIAVGHSPNPTAEAVETAMATYVAEVQRLFAEHKAAFGCDADETLVVE